MLRDSYPSLRSSFLAMYKAWPRQYARSNLQDWTERSGAPRLQHQHSLSSENANPRAISALEDRSETGPEALAPRFLRRHRGFVQFGSSPMPAWQALIWDLPQPSSHTEPRQRWLG